MRVLVCGGRWYDDYAAIRRVLDGLLQEARDHAQHGQCLGRSCTCLTVIEGGCRRWQAERRDWVGADHLAAEWAGRRNVGHEPYLADWEAQGRAAGPQRNRRMLEEGKPDVAYAFHDDLASSKGTAHMVRLAHEAGVPTYVVSRAR